MKSISRSRILYVEKDEFAFATVSSLLDFANLEVVSAVSLVDARTKIQNAEFDLYLLDYYFDEENSLDLCSHLRANFPKHPILYYSGSAYAEDKQKALDAGANVYFNKPYFKELYDAILTILKFSKNAESQTSKIYADNSQLA